MRNILIATCVVFVLLLIVAWVFVNGITSIKWLQSPGQIRTRLLEDVPIGSAFESVRGFIDDRGYVLVSSSERKGFISRDNREVGSAHLRARLGEYRLVFTKTVVAAYFAFNEKRELSEIDVRKYRDAP